MTRDAPVIGAPRATVPVPAAARELFGQARACLAEAAAAADPCRRYAAAHLAALRCAAAVLAVRAQPAGRSGRLRSAWVLLSRVAPELAEWAAFFAAGAGKRAAAEAGLSHSVSQREADDLVRAVESFRALCIAAAGADGAAETVARAG
ncbi:MAG TPA: SAV_6107 family HEPN domain-containing protein [Actinomycetes bacterium]|nr:SAV_6107 family HEPN domain-containing protein [Actinomycetes bacterium]